MTDEKGMKFREQIKKKLKSRDMSVPQLARKAGLNHQTIYNYLSGRTDMKGSNIEKLLKVLK